MIRLMRLSGRCRSGFEGDGGRLSHAVPNGEPWGKALCGAKPGRHSAHGFLDLNAPPEALPTCERCRGRLVAKNARDFERNLIEIERRVSVLETVLK